MKVYERDYFFFQIKVYERSRFSVKMIHQRVRGSTWGGGGGGGGTNPYRTL